MLLQTRLPKVTDPIDNSLHGIRPDKLVGPTVREVHVDFLLEEEFSVSPHFLHNFIEAAAKSFIKTASGPPERHPEFIKDALRDGAQFELASVRHSVSDQHGEADLILVYRHLNGTPHRVTILIEDKIGASFQPLQPERYRRRSLECNDCWTCLVASEKYIQRGHKFDAAVELEQLKQWFSSSDPLRARFKENVVRQAIEKSKMNGVKVVDEAMTNFRVAHYEFFKEYFKDELQDVSIRLPGPTWWGDSWFQIRSRRLPKGAYINHKSAEGSVDLTFPYTNASRLADIKPILEAGMRIEQTHKSAAIQLAVPQIEDFSSFEQERTKVAEAFSAATRLLRFYVRECLRLEPILDGARTVAST
jgi:hypothetical protein